jgi:CHAD domain-containing protein
VQPVFGRPARRFARRLKRVQSVLGAHQDAVITRGVLRDLAVRAHLGQENAFAYGVLHRREDAEAAGLQRKARRAWRKASKRRHRRWLG